MELQVIVIRLINMGCFCCVLFKDQPNLKQRRASGTKVNQVSCTFSKTLFSAFLFCFGFLVRMRLSLCLNNHNQLVNR